MKEALGNISVSAKVFVIVAIGVITAAAIGFTAYSGLRDVEKRTIALAEVSDEVRVVARMNQDALELNRAEYRLVANPDAAAEVSDFVAASRESFEARLERARARAGERQLALLDQVSAAYDAYEAELNQTIAAARAAANVIDASPERQALIQAVLESRAAIEILRARLGDYVRITDDLGDAAAANAQATVETATTTLVTIGLIGAALGLALGLLIARAGVASPLRRIVTVLKRLSTGDLETEVTETGRKDEIGDLAAAALVFRDNLARTKEMEEKAAAEEAARAERERAQMMAMADRFEDRVGAIVDTVSGAATELQATSQQLAAAVEETDSQSAAVVAAAEQSNTEVQSMASATEELSAAIDELTRRVSQSASMSSVAADGAREAQSGVDDLNAVIEQVDRIVGSIGEVAEQTNLLALNATIEAARAGEAGRGFAVVASEVKTLAAQTQKMTGEVDEQIEAIKASTVRVVHATRSIIEQIQSISQSTTEMASSVEQQGAATSEISRSAQEAAKGANEVTSSVTGIKAASAQTADASRYVTGSADDLAKQAGELSKQVRGFLDEVRTAA